MKKRFPRHLDLSDIPGLLNRFQAFIQQDIQGILESAAEAARQYAEQQMQSHQPYPKVGGSFPRMVDSFEIHDLDGKGVRLRNAVSHADHVEFGQGPHTPPKSDIMAWALAKGGDAMPPEELHKWVNGTIRKIQNEGTEPYPILWMTRAWLMDHLRLEFQSYGRAHDRALTPAYKKLLASTPDRRDDAPR